MKCVKLPTAELRAAMKRVGDLAFDTLYGAFGWQELEGTAQEIFRESMKRYDCN